MKNKSSSSSIFEVCLCGLAHISFYVLVEVMHNSFDFFCVKMSRFSLSVNVGVRVSYQSDTSVS